MRPHQRSDESSGAARVAIIGSGFSGIAAAVELQRQGITDITIFEKAAGIGGTWFANRYPGAEVDLESAIYSFSFEPWDWTRTHATWQELLDYLEAVATKHGLTEKVLLGEKVDEIEWVDSRSRWVVRTSSGRDHGSFAAVVSAVGFLNIPLVPPFARGEHQFPGTVCHTSEWVEGLDMTGKSVAVVGTGSSAVQVVPEAAKVAASVKVFQREPNWLLPKNARDLTPAERRRGRSRLVQRYRRLKLYLGYDLRQMRASHARSDGYTNRRRGAAAKAFLQESVPDPRLQELVTPSHPFEGRRTVISDLYYPSLRDPKVELVPHGVKELTSAGVKDDNGDEHALDVVVLATGFDAANFLGSYRVVGDHGVELHDVWAGEPAAFLGLMVPDFPNFFMLYGPNTNGIPLVTFYEAQARFAASLLTDMQRAGKRRIDVRHSAFHLYNEWIQAKLARTVWAQTANYFRGRTGRVVSQWPFGVTSYILATRAFRRLATTLR